MMGILAGVRSTTHCGFDLHSSAAAAKSLQSCLTLCDPRDGSPPGSPIPGILQARTLEWVAISSSNAWKWKVKVKSLSHVRLLATPWTAAHQAPLSMGFSRQEYWSGLPLPSLLHSSNNQHIQHLSMCILVTFLWRNVYLALLPIFWLRLFFILRCMSCKTTAFSNWWHTYHSHYWIYMSFPLFQCEQIVSKQILSYCYRLEGTVPVVTLSLGTEEISSGRVQRLRAWHLLWFHHSLAVSP